MIWRYQILAYPKPTYYRLCEVFYDEGKKKSWGYSETDIVGESVEDIKEILFMMIDDVAYYPVLKTSDFKMDKEKKRV